MAGNAHPSSDIAQSLDVDNTSSHTPVYACLFNLHEEVVIKSLY